MKLHGIQAEPGTLFPMDYHSGRFTVADGAPAHGIDKDGNPYDVTYLRFATQEDMANLRGQEPRSVCEHHAVGRVPSPYGMVRIFKPVPRQRGPR